MIRVSYYNNVLKPLIDYQIKLKKKKGIVPKILLLLLLRKKIKKKTKEFYKLFDDKYVK
ncbi:MAG: hypothetical protein ACI31M_02425 [Bacilli bacterium]